MLTDELMREVRRLQLRTRRRVEGLFAGEYHSAFKGRGIEFAEVREYEAGDDVRAIDWNVTARMGKPFIKRFIEERELTVMLAVDMSASSDFGTGERARSRLIIELCAVLAVAAVTNNDRVGLLIFTDRVELFVPPRKGSRHLLRVLRELLAFEPRGAGTDIAGALDHLGKLVRRSALVFVVSDFLAHDFQRALRALANRHETIALRVSDPMEAELPPIGLIELEDAESGERRTVDAGSRRWRRAYAAAAKRLRAETDRAFVRAGVDQVQVSTDRSFVDDLARYFRIREARR